MTVPQISVRHDTTYAYFAPASLSYYRACLQPLSQVRCNHFMQKLESFTLHVDPAPRLTLRERDVFANVQAYFEIDQPHDRLLVRSEAKMSQTPIGAVPLAETPELLKPWESLLLPELRATLPTSGFIACIYPSQRVPDAADAADIVEFARESFTPARSIIEALMDFTHRIHEAFSYEGGSTHVDTPVTEAWSNKKGVCQDFSHFGLTGLRGLGLLTAYVSGYMLTEAPEGEEKLVGSDASHAWIALWVPGFGWLHADPTNDCLVDDRYIVTAIGRDYSDIPPLQGVSYGADSQPPVVGVTVSRDGLT
ncbi:transglutaminase family protein [Allohahella marinimesophila]|uniref:Transglutaminase family protein n=1 Tax=Allohahella marinimesophila TaxID=1054972 RepID=A0ABP7PUX3_9GAMM